MTDDLCPLVFCAGTSAYSNAPRRPGTEFTSSSSPLAHDHLHSFAMGEHVQQSTFALNMLGGASSNETFSTLDRPSAGELIVNPDRSKKANRPEHTLLFFFVTSYRRPSILLPLYLHRHHVVYGHARHLPNHHRLRWCIQSIPNPSCQDASQRDPIDAPMVRHDPFRPDRTFRLLHPPADPSAIAGKELD